MVFMEEYHEALSRLQAKGQTGAQHTGWLSGEASCETLIQTRSSTQRSRSSGSTSSTLPHTAAKRQ